MNKILKTSVLVMNCHYNGLSLIQSLGRRGISVIAVDSKRSIGTRSRYADYLNIADPSKDRAGFIKSLVEFGSAFEVKPIIFPTNDHWAEALAWGAEELSVYYHLCVTDIDTVSLLLDKEKFGRWAMDNDIQVPYIWSSIEAFESADSLKYPVAVKANTRRRSGQVEDAASKAKHADRLRFVLCNNEIELKSKLAEAESVGVPVFCQQVVNGRSDAMRTIGVYANKGKIYGLVYGRKLKGFPAQYGDCIVGQAEAVPDWARDLAVKCCSLLGYTGIAELEVMIDENTGSRHLIEINPRSWSWVGVGPCAGVDLSWIAYQDMVHDIQPDKCIEGCADGQPVYYTKVLADFQNTVFWYRFSTAPEWAQSPRDWKKTFKGKRGVYAEFSRDDLGVSFFSLLISARQFFANAYKLIRGYRFD